MSRWCLRFLSIQKRVNKLYRLLPETLKLSLITEDKNSLPYNRLVQDWAEAFSFSCLFLYIFTDFTEQTLTLKGEWRQSEWEGSLPPLLSYSALEFTQSKHGYTVYQGSFLGINRGKKESWVFIPLQKKGKKFGILIGTLPKSLASSFILPILVEATNTLSTGISLLEEIAVLVDQQNEERRVTLYHEIHNKLIRHKVPERPEVSIDFFVKPKLGIHSDYVDWFSLGGREFLLIHGEVTGKGFNAVLTLTVLKALLEVLAHASKSPAIILTRINTVATRFFYGDFFASLTILHINLESETLAISKAGRGGVIQISSIQKNCTECIQEQVPVGTHKKYRFKSDVLPLHSGDIWALYSDGLVETVDKNGKAYGVDRLLTLIQAHKFFEGKQILEKVKEDLQEFKGEKPYVDDISLVIVKFR